MLKGNRLIALDVGSKRIGVAISDHAGMLAHPLMTLEAHGARSDAEAVTALCAAQEASGVVIGLPAHADGTESTSAKRSRKLGEALLRRAVDVDYMDEWGTSVDARDALAHRSGSKHKQDKGLIDQAAAVSILSGYLELRRRQQVRDTPPEDDA